jgi:hypothetical protein
MSEKTRKRSSTEIARSIRSHLKAGMTRADIMEAESLTPKQYRWGLLTLGKFPKKNIEAFATFLADETVRLDQIAEDMQLARAAGDFRALAAFHRIVSEIKTGSMELALKLGLLKKAAEGIDLEPRTYEVCFGDENLKPNWPTIE